MAPANADILRQFEIALDEFGRRVHAVAPDQWQSPTPCSEWDVRAVLDHLVWEMVWVPPMLAGMTVAEVGDRFDGDRLGDDPVAAWDAADKAARSAFTEPGAFDGPVHLSFGTVTAADYCRQMTDELLIHTWDLARSIGGDEELDAELVDETYTRTLPRAAGMARSGVFGTTVSVPDEADRQTKLLALFGRRV